ncbi:universal stress A, partial [Olea europaea subsp. europaea]
MAENGRKILVAIDEGDESMYALTWCLNNVISEHSKDTLILCYVKPPRAVSTAMEGTVWAFSPDVMASIERYSNGVAQCVIDKAKRACKHLNDVKVDIAVEQGDPRDMICELAEKLNVDMLVMGSHGYGLIK